MSEKQPDRVSYTYGMKIGLPNYSSVDFHVSMSSDVKDGETPEKAHIRVKKFVDAQIEKEMEDAQSLTEK